MKRFHSVNIKYQYVCKDTAGVNRVRTLRKDTEQARLTKWYLSCIY